MSEDSKQALQSEIKKTSMQILSELFGTFDAEPPIIVKKEKKDKKDKKDSEEGKKSKKKHKHKDKKHKKKSKKRKRSLSGSSSSSSDESELDLAKILIKQEKDFAEKKIKIEGTNITLDLAEIKQEIIKRETDLKEPKPSIADLEAKIKKEESSSVKQEIKSEGESDSDSKRHKRKHKHKDKDRKRSRSRDRKLYRLDDLRNKIKDRKQRSRSRDKNRERSSSRDRDRRHRDRSGSRERDRFRDRSRDRDFYRKTTYRDTKYERLERSFRQWGRDDSFYNPRPRSRSRSRDRSAERGRWSRDVRRRSRSRERPPREESSSRIDKKKLLEIARKNAIQMMKSGSLPGALTLGAKAQEKVIAAIKSGGKTIEELTDFCKTLSKKEELGELSSDSEREESDAEEAFHHPFQIKDRPTTITMNIKNSVPLPTKTTQERSTELRLQFPVSSGQQHRSVVNEEWVPVSPPSAQKAIADVPKPPKQVATVAPQPPLAIMPPPPLPPMPPLPPELPKEPEPVVVPMPSDAPGPQLMPASAVEKQQIVDKNVDISSIVSQRLAAMKKLHENPNDVQALTQMYKVNKDMQTWAKAQEQFSQLTGAFTGSTGAQILSQAELNSGYQAWAKKGQLTNAAPVSGGMGMHLLQKMGWKPGEGLGKEKTGTLEPLLLEVKTDKKGLVATEEQKGKNNKKKGGAKAPVVKTLEGKHPVSLLGEYAQKRKLGAPQYVLEFECGPDHKKNFLFKVILNGLEYKPNIASINKKEAKAHAATVALKGLGLLA